MAEMRTLGCPECEQTNQPISVLEGIEEYRCRSCGLVYYGPCGCDTVHEPVGSVLRTEFRAPESFRMPEDFLMQRPAIVSYNASTVQKFPGCS